MSEILEDNDQEVDNTEVESNEDELENDDSQEETEEETQDDEQVDDTDDSDDSEDEGSDEDSQYLESEEEYLGQFEGLPEGLKTTDDVMNAYLATLPEMKKGQTSSKQLEQLDTILKSRGIENGVNGLLNGATAPNLQSQQQTEQGKSYFNDTPFAGVFKEWETNNMFGDDATKTSYQSLAKFADAALTPFIKEVEGILTTQLKNVVQNRNNNREIMWRQYEHPQKSAVEKADVFKAMEQYGLDDFDKAMGFVTYSNPDLIKKVSQKAEERGMKKGQKKLKRKTAMSRSKTTGAKKHNYSDFQDNDGGWIDSKLMALPDYGVAMLDAWTKEHKKK